MPEILNALDFIFNVSAPPKIDASSGSILRHKRGENIHLFCIGHATPQPSLVWRRNGIPIEASKRLSVNGTLVIITDLQPNDGGLFSCTFSNAVGEISQLIKLVVEGKIEPIHQTITDFITCSHVVIH